MLNVRSRALLALSLACILIFAFAVTVSAQKTSKKKPVNKSGRSAPTLKPATPKAAPSTKPEAKTSDTAKTETKETKDAAPKTEAKTEAKEAAPQTSTAKAETPAGDQKQNPAAPNPKAAAKPAAEEAKEKAASKTGASKSKTKGKAVVAKAAPVKEAAKENAPAKEKAAEEKTAKAATATEKTVDKTADKTAGKTDTAATAKKAEPKKKTAPAVAGKKADPKKRVTVAAVTAEKKPEPKKEAPKKKAEPKVEASASAKVKPEEATVAPAPAKVWLAPITAERLRADLTGKTLADIQSEESGDGRVDWLFAGNQPKDVEILKVDRTGDERIVEARLTAKKARPNLDGSFDRVRGTARFHYERGAKNWELLYIENVSLRHGDTALDSPPVEKLQKPVTTSTTAATTTTATTTTTVFSPPPLNILPGGTNVLVGAGKYQSYSFQVREAAVVTGRFAARGGRQNDIETYILDQDGFLNWTNDHSAPAYYNSGRLTVGSIDTVLGAGTYYLVFNNRYSAEEGKTVDANIQLRTDAATLSAKNVPVDRLPNSTAGTINIVRRTYAPSANPVQPYIRPAKTDDAVAKKPLKDFAPEVRQVPPKISEVAGYRDEVVLSNRFQIAGGQHYAVPFEVKDGGAVKGNFVVAGGNNGGVDITAYIMTAAQYEKWTYTREAVLDYSSGRASSGSIDRHLNPGNYYVVFSNHFSPREAKSVRAEIQVEYLPR